MGYCKPFKRGASWRSQNYGANPNNGTNGPAGHSGCDEACSIGTPVHAAGDGVVIYVGQFDSTYADNLLWLIDFGGNILVLDCGNDEPTFVYAHLSKFRVKAGDSVRKGQVIADSGNSGTRTSGPHCHVEAFPPGYVLNSPSLGRVNPDIYLTEWPDDYVGLAAMGGTTIQPQEDTLSQAEVKQIIDHFNRVILGPYSWTDGEHPTGVRGDVLGAVAAVPGNVWGTTVSRTVGDAVASISALQELADAKTLAIQSAARESAMSDVLRQVLATPGSPVDMDKVQAASEAGAAKALAGLKAKAVVTIEQEEG